MKRLLPAFVAALLIAAPSALDAQLGIGGQVSYADDFDFGVGARVTLGLPVEAIPLEAVGSFDFFFPDIDEVDYWEVNLGVNYLIALAASPIVPYAGAGLNIARVSVDVATGFGDFSASDTEIGLNLQGGAKFEAGPVTPYGEVRIELGGGEQFVITGGVAFNVGPGI